MGKTYRKFFIGLDQGTTGTTSLLLDDEWNVVSQGYKEHTAGWRGTWELDGGGCLMNQAVHTLDVLSWLVGGVESTKAKVFTLARDIEVEDTAFALLKFQNKAYGVFEAATIYTPGIGVKIEIQCEHGRIEFDGSNAVLIKPDQNDGAVELCLNDEAAIKDGVANNHAALGLTGNKLLKLPDVAITQACGFADFAKNHEALSNISLYFFSFANWPYKTSRRHNNCIIPFPKCFSILLIIQHLVVLYIFPYDILLELIKSKRKTGTRKIILKPKLIIRDSCISL